MKIGGGNKNVITLLFRRRLEAPENLPPILNPTNCDVEVSYLPQNVWNVQEKFLKAEAELHRIKTKANKLDPIETCNRCY